MNKKFEIYGKYSLITGAGGLLGVEHSLALLEVGSNLVITDINLERLNGLKKYLNSKFPQRNIVVYEMDVTNEDSIVTVQKSLEKENIKVNILVNNAAINPKAEKDSNINSSSRLENFSRNAWDIEISVGLTGAFLCSKVFGAKMASSGDGGCIINIASDLSIIAPDQRLYKLKGVEEGKQPVKPITYSVIKSGLIGLTKYLATYWAESKVRCNALSPGGIYTSQPEEFVQKIRELIPIKRMAKSDEYRSAIQFLCSEASSYMNGHNLVMDGGRSVW